MHLGTASDTAGSFWAVEPISLFLPKCLLGQLRSWSTVESQQAGDSASRSLGVRTGCSYKSLPQAVLSAIPGCVQSFVCLPYTPFNKCSRGWRDSSVGKEFAV